MLKKQFAEFLWWIKRVPATSLIIFISIVVGLFTKSLWVSAETSGLVERLGYGLVAFRSGDFISVFAGLFIAPSPWMYITILIPIAIGGGYIEYKYGTVKMLITLMLSHVFAVVSVAILLLCLQATNLEWARELAMLRDVGLSNAGFGALGVMTAGLESVWRRRARVGLLLYCLSFILYSGEIWDLTHMSALLFGLSIGPWIVGRKYQKFKFSLSNQEARSFIAVMVLFVAVARLVSRLYPGNGGLLEFHANLNTQPVTLLFIVAISLLNIVIAYGLYAGRRVAWYITVFITSLMFLSSFIVQLSAASVFNAFFTLLLITLLIAFRKSFQVVPDRIGAQNLLRRILTAALFLFVFNTLAIYALRHNYNPSPDLFDAAKESLYQIVGVSSRGFYPVNNFTRLFTNSISLGWLVFVLVSFVYIVMNTIRNRDNSEKNFEEYKNLLIGKGSSTIGWMSTWDGMSYWLNMSKTAGFAYKLENNIAIVLSDPVGSRQAVSASVSSFVDMCSRRGWHPVYFSVTDKFRRATSKQQLKSIVIGEDTIIDLADLEFKGKSWQSIRSSINLANKLGINMRSIKYSEAPIGLKDQLRTIANGWVSDKSLPEMGFTLGTLKEAEDVQVRMNIAVDSDATVHGMTSWMPVYRNGKIIGWTIDIMQRRLSDETMKGVIEYLIAESALAFKQEGYEFISLSAAPLSHSGKPTGSIEKLLDIIATRMEPYYGFKSLFNFKKKFNPRHEPMYLCYYDEARLPSIALAIGKAYMPEKAFKDIVGSTIKSKL